MRQRLHQVLLDLLGIGRAREAEAHRQPLDVGVDDDPSAIPYAVPSTTLAVLRATPGSVVSSASVLGTSPPKRSSSPCAVPFRLLAFWRKKPVDRMIFSSAGSGALAMASGVG